VHIVRSWWDWMRTQRAGAAVEPARARKARRTEVSRLVAAAALSPADTRRRTSCGACAARSRTISTRPSSSAATTVPPRRAASLARPYRRRPGSARSSGRLRRCTSSPHAGTPSTLQRCAAKRRSAAS
jgi:hypothetical protein